MKSLQLVQKAAARVQSGTKRRDHITPFLASLHCLPVKFKFHGGVFSLHSRPSVGTFGIPQQFLRTPPFMSITQSNFICIAHIHKSQFVS